MTGRSPLNSLEQHIARDIRMNGPMDMARFMALALGHPVHGYYMKQDPIGMKGDFTTAPEISQIFGELLGAWFAQSWIDMGRPPAFTLLECGPGRGTLMGDMMRAARHVEGFHEAAQLHLLESSPALRNAQEDILGSYDPVWHESLDSVPRDRPVLAIGNEFLDALPIRQLEKMPDKGWCERVIACEDTLEAEGGDDFEGKLPPFVFAHRPAGAELMALVPEGLRSIESGIVEISPARGHFTQNLCELMKSGGGGRALFIDYGYVKSAAGDTFQAVQNHRMVSPLGHVGNCDLTAHVDFDSVARIGHSMGVQVSDIITQGAFLKALGIEARADFLASRNEGEAGLALKEAVARLVSPQQMGALFKVIVFSYT